MAEKRKLEFDSSSGVSEAESADIHGVIATTFLHFQRSNLCMKVLHLSLNRGLFKQRQL